MEKFNSRKSNSPQKSRFDELSSPSTPNRIASVSMFSKNQSNLKSKKIEDMKELISSDSNEEVETPKK